MITDTKPINTDSLLEAIGVTNIKYVNGKLLPGKNLDEAVSIMHQYGANTRILEPENYVSRVLTYKMNNKFLYVNISGIMIEAEAQEGRHFDPQSKQEFYKD